MNIIKKFLQALIVGAGTWVGIHIAKKGIETVTDPYKRTVAKQKMKAIKDTLFKKEDGES